MTVTRVGPAVEPPPDLACPVCRKPREAPGDPLCSAVHDVPPPPAPLSWATPQPIDTVPKSGRVLLSTDRFPGWYEVTLNGLTAHKDWRHWLPLPPPPDDPAWAEAHLERAVVVAALTSGGLTSDGTSSIWRAVSALRAHRAKKEEK